MTKLQSAAATAVFLFALSCGPEGDPPQVPDDAGNATTPDAERPDADRPDADTPPPIEPGTRGLLPPQEGIDPAGLESAGIPAQGEARAYRVDARGGFDGVWAHCKAGDVRLVNALIDVCLSGAESNRYELFSGGAIVDVQRHTDSGPEVFDLFKPRVQFNMQRARTVDVTRDGTAGGPVVVRVTGQDIPVAHFVGVVGTAVLRSQKIDLVTEYRLWPDSDAVEIYTVANNDSGGPRTFSMGDWTAYGDRAAVFRPDAGFDIERTIDFEWAAGFGQGRAYGVVQSEPLTSENLPFGSIPWVLTNTGNERLEEGESRDYFRWFVVGEGDAESIRARAAGLGAITIPETTQELRLVDAAGAPIGGRTVEIWRGESAMTAVVTDPGGEASFRADAGSYRVVVETPPGEETFDREVDFDGTAEIELPTAGTIEIAVDATAGGSSGTAAVTLFGPGRVDGVALHGAGSWDVAPGIWRVVVKRGPEWSVFATDVTVTAGETVAVAATIAPRLDTAGWISADFHQHMEPSIDSEVNVVDRVLDNVGHGVEFVTPTDHESITDLGPFVAELGLEDELGTFPGIEVSPAITHVGLYPMEYVPDERGRGGISLAVINEDDEAQQRTIPEIIEMARQLPSDPVVQINHGRDNSGLFRTGEYDPEAEPTQFVDTSFTLDFDAMEIINRFDDICILYRDYAGLWNAGYNPTGLGNSDSHGLWGDVGTPRNWLRIDKPVADVTADDIRTAIREHRVTVGAHAFIDFRDGRIPGDTVVSTVGTGVDFHLRVQSATYASANVLVTIANGEVIDERPITSIDDVVDFDDIVTHAFDEDTWITFFVWGPRPSGDVSYNDPVVAFTNPLFVDVDGDADGDGNPWEAPGVRTLDLSQLSNPSVCSVP